jgi:hypothetical protein
MVYGTVTGPGTEVVLTLGGVGHQAPVSNKQWNAGNLSTGVYTVTVQGASSWHPTTLVVPCATPVTITTS